MNKILISILILSFTILSCANTSSSMQKKENESTEKILFVVTSHNTLGDTGKPTGYYLAEVTHAWKVLVDAGYEIDFVSPKGGTPPVDGFDLDDSVNKEFWSNEYYRNKIENGMEPSEIKPSDYVAIYYAGGHGVVWDLPYDETMANIGSQIYENKGVVGAVCHGPAAIVNIKLQDGNYLVKGKMVNGFSNDEERAVELDKVVPFLLEDMLVERGGLYEKGDMWAEYVVSDQRLVTGQNPQSAKAVAIAMLKVLKSK